ncbi:MAG: class I SAM-dependent methyltransferase [Burkholderiales bacterium]|nr:class I SAM-dependent methyltransferase [Burkholderiales bacterium]
MQTTAAHPIQPPPAPLAHSEEHFGAHRDYWWNPDFLDLMAQRWQLSGYRQLLDVGCGRCHWSLQLAQRMAAGTHVVAMDYDPKWAAGDAGIPAAFATHGATLEFRQGDAHRLPYADDSFDVVSCQTVLMHLADPLAALKEMRRVVRPGGIVICVEPCNLAQAAIANSLNAENSVDELCDAFRYALLCERGKQAAGEGVLSLGDRLPQLFRLAGFDNVVGHLSDKARPNLPPYADRETQAKLAERLSMQEEARGALWEGQVNRWIAALADPQAQAFVARYHARRPARLQQMTEQLAAGAYWDSGSALSYLVSAKK